MKFSAVAITALSLLPSLSLGQVAAGGGVIPSGPQPTTVWVTTTNAAGVVATIPSLYTQTFRDPPPMSSLKSGTIGLGQWGPKAAKRDEAHGAHEEHHAKKTPAPFVDRHKRCAHGNCH